MDAIKQKGTESAAKNEKKDHNLKPPLLTGFKVTPNMQEAEFKEKIIDKYFSQYNTGEVKFKSTMRNADGTKRQDKTDKTKVDVKLTDDQGKWESFGKACASIGAFLTRRDDVRLALQPMETQLRQTLGIETTDDHDTACRKCGIERSENPKESNTGYKRLSSDENGNTPWKKALTNILADFEKQHGFNVIEPDSIEAETLGLSTHIELKAGDKLGNTDAKLETTTDAAITTGDLSPAKFNQLIQSGTQFKDVGAGPEHGENTHRLQWYALAQGTEIEGDDGKPLVNLHGLDLKEVFTMMGDTDWAKSWDVMRDGNSKEDNTLKKGSHLFMWEALFDAGQNERLAEQRSTVAHCDNTFNCPENMVIALTTLDKMEKVEDGKEVKNVKTFTTPADDDICAIKMCTTRKMEKRYDTSAESLQKGDSYEVEKSKAAVEDDRFNVAFARDNKSEAVIFRTKKE